MICTCLLPACFAHVNDTLTFDEWRDETNRPGELRSCVGSTVAPLQENFFFS